MKKSTVVILISVIGLLLLIIAGGGYYLLQRNTEMETLVKQSEEQKLTLEDEYEQLSIQYDGFKDIALNNDTLKSQLMAEKAKVKRLLEELKATKATDAARISELQKELKTLRGVLRNFVIQIDSLNRENAALKNEKTQLKQTNATLSQTTSQLQKEKEKLSEKVTLASKLDARDIVVTPVTDRGKVATRISKTEQLKIAFALSKNPTAQVGEKYIYVRIMKPDEDVLIKDMSNVFRYEDRDINYSIRKLIEYDGEDMDVVMYWKVEEFLNPGTYRVDVFCDGNMIGSRSFSLKK